MVNIDVDVSTFIGIHNSPILPCNKQLLSLVTIMQYIVPSSHLQLLS